MRLSVTSAVSEPLVAFDGRLHPLVNAPSQTPFYALALPEEASLRNAGATTLDAAVHKSGAHTDPKILCPSEPSSPPHTITHSPPKAPTAADDDGSTPQKHTTERRPTSTWRLKATALQASDRDTDTRSHTPKLADWLPEPEDHGNADRK